jgi:phosphoribosylanthranilate isomerase
VIVKICGITRSEDAQLAVSLGATAVGFVCWPNSPRYISPSRAAAIAATLPASVLTVGVFVNASRDHIEAVAEEICLGAVQLHGQETPEFAQSLERKVIKALPLDILPAGEPLAPWTGITVLLDAHDPLRQGGTGRVVDWSRAADLAAVHDVILAGGLRPDNIIQAVARVRPVGVDVSSGVEAAPGVKDEGKLRALFEALRGVEA